MGFIRTAEQRLPVQVVGLTAVAVSTTQIDLSWAAAARATSYKIRRDGLVIATGVTALVYQDLGLTPDTSYLYTVTGVNFIGEGLQSASVVGTTTVAGWLPFTGPTFIHGQGEQNWSFAPYAPPSATAFQWHPNGSPGTPAGVTLDSPGKRLVYDGGGSVGVTSGLILEDIQSAEADWQSRISGPGVVWAHDFRNDAEFTNFAKSGTGVWASTLAPVSFHPSSRAIQSKGLGTAFAQNATNVATTFTLSSVVQFPNPAVIGAYTLHCGTAWDSGIVEVVRVNSINYGANTMSVTRAIQGTAQSYTAGVGTVGAGASSEWRRPFARLPGTQNGKGVDDPGANNTVTMRSWSGYGPSSGNWGFGEGLYGNAAYQNANFDGSEFWIQFRAKIHSNRFSGGRKGKFWFLQRVAGSTNRQFFGHIRNASAYETGRWFAPPAWPYDWDSVDGGTYINVQHNYGSVVDGTPNGASSALQVGGQYGSTCLSGGGTCLLYPPNEWCTWLIHVIPGQDGQPTTTFELFLQLPGESSYRTVISTATHTVAAQGGEGTLGWNSFWPVNYMNDYFGSGSESPPLNDTLIEYTQIIFSKQHIPVSAA